MCAFLLWVRPRQCKSSDQFFKTFFLYRAEVAIERESAEHHRRRWNSQASLCAFAFETLWCPLKGFTKAPDAEHRNTKM